jgi:hypothetical protein
MSADFISAVNQMREHYKSDATRPFVTQHHAAPMAATGTAPQTATTPTGFAKLRTSSQAQLPAGFDDLLETAKSQETAMVERIKTDLRNSVDQFKADKDWNSFVSRTNAQRAKVKAESDRTTDEVFDQAIAMNQYQNQPPEIQQLMFQGLNVVANTIQRVFDVADNFIEGLLEDTRKGPLDTPVRSVDDGFRPALELLTSL